MANQLLYSVNFGYGRTGLSSVGYTIYNTDGSVYQSRTTSGVVEFGTTGIYGCMIDRSASDSVIIWDTGEDQPLYAAEDSRVQIDSIVSESERIKIIWNSLKNQGELLNSLMDKLGLIEKNVGMTKQDVTDAVSAEVSKIKIPEVKIPEFPSIPDNSAELENIKNAISSSEKAIKSIAIPALEPVIAKVEEVKSMVSALPKDSLKEEELLRGISSAIEKIPTTQAEYSGNFKAVEKMIEDALAILQKKADDKSVKIVDAKVDSVLKARDYLKSAKDIFSKLDDLIGKVKENADRVKCCVDESKKSVEDSKDEIQEDIKESKTLLEQIAKKNGLSFLPTKEEWMMTLGHLS